MLEFNKISFKKIISFYLVLILLIGCSWQSIKLLQLYLSYPTKIQILTDIDLYEDNLASFSICKNIRNKHNGKHSDNLFKYYKSISIDREISFFLDNKQIPTNSSGDGLINLIIMISKTYFCYVVKCIKLVISEDLVNRDQVGLENGGFTFYPFVGPRS